MNNQSQNTEGSEAQINPTLDKVLKILMFFALIGAILIIPVLAIIKIVEYFKKRRGGRKQ